MTYRTPGVYVEEISVFPPSVAEVETAIPAFIGFTEFVMKDGVDISQVDEGPSPIEPILIYSLKEYEQIFGYAKEEPSDAFEISVNEKQNEQGDVLNFELSYTTTGDLSRYRLYYAMQMFFANGGGKCYIMSVGNYSAAIDAPKFTAGIEKIKILDEPTLLVIPEAVSLSAGDHKTICENAITQSHDLKDRFAILDVRIDDPTNKELVPEDITAFRTISKEYEYLRYGAGYYPYLKTTFNYRHQLTDAKNYDLTISEITVNGKAPVAGSPNQPHFPTGALEALKATNNAAYNSLVSEVNSKLKVMLPPSSSMAGIYASVDRNRGVWKAPANVGVSNTIGPSILIDNSKQDTLNIDSIAGKSINVIRSFSGRGTIVWGARTLDGNSNEWRYINVRRFFNMVEESVQKSTVWTVFEPNTKNTWVMVTSMIENYLITKWQQGALAGAKPDDAFYVKCGLGVTMTADDILNGIMNVEIGMAVARPAEFIVLKFSHKMQVS